MTNEVLRSILSLREQRQVGALCTIVKTSGSTPLKTGAQMVVRPDGSIAGTIGGGALEFGAISEALLSIATSKSALFEHRLTKDHDMCCGGSVSLFVEVLEISSQCYIFGAGHVGKALAHILSNLDMEVTVVDDRPNIFDGWKKDLDANSHPNFIQQLPSVVLPSLIWDSRTYAVIATHSHALDRELLRQAIRLPFRFCGMIGSKRKVLVTRTLFLERGLATEEQLDRIDMPVGIDISASSPGEIAVSIAARIIEVKNHATLTRTAAVAPRLTPDISSSINSPELKERSSADTLHRSDDIASLVHPTTSDYTHDLICAATTL